MPYFHTEEIDGQEFKVHPDVYKTGGVKIVDEGKLLPAAVKDCASKIAKAAFSTEPSFGCRNRLGIFLTL